MRIRVLLGLQPTKETRTLHGHDRLVASASVIHAHMQHYSCLTSHISSLMHSNLCRSSQPSCTTLWLCVLAACRVVLMTQRLLVLVTWIQQQVVASALAQVRRSMGSLTGVLGEVHGVTHRCSWKSSWDHSQVFLVRFIMMVGVQPTADVAAYWAV